MDPVEFYSPLQNILVLDIIILSMTKCNAFSFNTSISLGSTRQAYLSIYFYVYVCMHVSMYVNMYYFFVRFCSHSYQRLSLSKITNIQSKPAKESSCALLLPFHKAEMLINRSRNVY